MPFLSKRDPYNAGYNIPKTVLDEPWWRGVRVTSPLPRRSVSPTTPVAAPWNSRYAIPSSVERTGVMPHVTKYRKRGTISDTIPVESWLEGVDDMGNGTLGDGMTPHGVLGSREGQGVLGSTDGNFGRAGTKSVGGKGDPVVAFGREGAKIVLAEVRTLTDPALRKAALRAILEGIDSGLWSVVEARAAKLKNEKKYDAQTALEKAISIEFANRYLGQVVKLGKTGAVPTRGPLSLAYAEGLGACTCATQESLGFGWGSITGGASALVGGAAKVAGAGVGVAKAASSVASTALNKLGSLACAVGSSSALKTAVVTAASIKGGQAGAAAAGKGAAVASKICAANPKGAPSPGDGGGGGYADGGAPAAAKSGFPMMPVLIGGGILAAVLLLKKKG